MPLLAIVLTAALLQDARPTPRLDSVEVRRWREDLEWLSREMPANHAQLFHTLPQPQFDSSLSAFRARLPSMTRHQVIVELARLVARIGDGHTNVSPWRDTVIAFRELPVAFYRFSDGYHVRSAKPEYRALLGARVIRIGGISIDSAEALVGSLIARDNPMAVWFYGPLLLRMPEVLHAIGVAPTTERVELTLETRSGRQTVVLSPAGLFPNLSGDVDRSWNARPGWVDLRDGSPTPLWLRGEEAIEYWYRYLPESRTLYCQINTIQERSGDPLDPFLTRAIRTADSAGGERLVLDLRRNGGGNGYYNRTIVRALVRSRFDERGRLLVLTGRRTFSAAEFLIDELEQWSHPIFVGEPSSSRGNHYGDSRRLYLPNSRVTVRVSTLRWQKWDPRDDRPWIAPHAAAALSSQDYAAGRDPVLETAIRYRWTPPLADALLSFAAQGDTDGALRAIESFAANSLNAWQDVNRILSILQRNLAASGRTNEANVIGRVSAVWARRG